MLEFAIKTIENSTKILLRYFGKNFWIKSKSFKDIITEADIQSEESIIKKIRKKFPHHSIYSEESGLQNNTSDYLRIIDPLDGTGNFERGIPVYGISVGLLYKNEPLL